MMYSATLSRCRHESRVQENLFQRLRLLTAVLLAAATCSCFGVLNRLEAQDAPVRDAAHKIQLKDLDGHFPFEPPKTLEAWQTRSEHLRRQLLVSLGLWPRPTMAKLDAVVHSERAMDGYSMSKVYFESLPGLYVTGTLYKPATPSPTNAKAPAMLVAHGHWDHGRFYWAEDSEVAQLLATGAERFESAAHNHLQAKCVQLARMGCVVFQYDMLGYADSQQISFDRGHRFGLAGSNPNINGNGWLLYSPQAEGHLQSVMALQTINSLQAFEFLANRPDVDVSRIGITGASGGGTQAFIAAAIEPRIATAFPAVMVSTGMQGGCTCENACCLRVDTGNVEIAGLIAPRPLGMTAADDWTRTMPKDGFPELRQLYQLMGAKDRVSLYPSLHFPHNYNHVARVALYGFVNRTFELGMKEPILERDFEVLRGSELSVWDDQHPAPPSGLEFEAKLLKSWAEDVQRQLKTKPELARQGWDMILAQGRALAQEANLKLDGSAADSQRAIRNSDGTAVGILVHRSSKDSIQKIQLQAAKLSGGQLVAPEETDAATFVFRDAYGLDNEKEQALVKNSRNTAIYTFGYNAPQAVRKLAVLIRLIDELTQGGKTPLTLDARGDSELGFFATAAQSLRPQAVRVEGVSKAYDFSQVDSIRHPMFVPGALRFQSFSQTK